ncbi:N-6 DNA methylase [Enterococcus faecium]|uniref:N-6 DNA methylase n=1 Tax=Enterococcus TaxID=1350 RepID=UPI000A332C4E|nr:MULTISPECIES: N-6 DNA methylase [Enterococcus]EMF0170138.1 N-6 DNA methylase [Enterococcus hirae]EGP4716733.1 N-6 DNA methylase [Enterococcus faecium]EGP4780370.1 N-6 DNA methylase [Enterococcus faecium]EGP4829493.1 N-6 DNA methylase [Enterococcus faecium]EGP4884773.1 N-6 DNA methylase [Enterococcus faecium]
MKEEIIKSKIRVQKHGEVFTPKRIVNKMLDIPEVKDACENLTATFLEPAAGEGAFLVAILERKLNMVSEKYNKDLIQYENYSLLALTTLYGIELLEDNAQTCVMNMFQQYYDKYKEQVEHHGGKLKEKVLDSAKKIISLNICNGNFLTRKSADGSPLVFSEWQPINMRKTLKNIKIQRTEYTLDEIYGSVKKESGRAINNLLQEPVQLDLFDFLEDESENINEFQKEMRYIPVKITDVYRDEMEEANG